MSTNKTVNSCISNYCLLIVWIEFIAVLTTLIIQFKIGHLELQNVILTLAVASFLISTLKSMDIAEYASLSVRCIIVQSYFL